MKKADLIAGVILLFFSAYIVLESLQMPFMAEFGPDYGFFPIWLGILMLILSFLLLVNAWRQPISPEDKPPFTNLQTLKNAVFIVLSLAAYLVLIETIGYLLDTFLFILLIMLVVHRERSFASLAISAIAALGLYFIFHEILQVNLPSLVDGALYKNLRQIFGGALPIKLWWL